MILAVDFEQAMCADACFQFQQMFLKCVQGADSQQHQNDLDHTTHHVPYLPHCLLRHRAVRSCIALPRTAAAAPADETSTQATQKTLQRNMQAFGRGDLEAIVSNYADDAVLIAQGETHTGKAAMRSFFEALLKEFRAPGVRFTLQSTQTAGRLAFILWNAKTAQRTFALGTDTFVVENGRIVYQTFTYHLSRD